MKIARFQRSGQIVLVAEVDDRYFDITSTPNGFSDVRALLSHPDPAAALKVIVNEAAELSLSDELQVAPPLDVQEVWASGVTYFRSKVARIGETVEGRAFYDKVYAADRPELFFKSAASRVVGHLKPVRIRRDSIWNVPEPELALVLSSSGRIVGYTIGNDMSSRSLEGENPLYIPQAKVYDASCALGPWILVANESNLPDGISMTVSRSATEVFSGETRTSKMRRPPQELADYLFSEISFPDGVFLLTGTGIVPPDDFSLKIGDIIKITIDGIGTLENQVA